MKMGLQITELRPSPLQKINKKRAKKDQKSPLNGHFSVISGLIFWGNYKKNRKKITYYCHNVPPNRIGHNVGVEMCHHRGDFYVNLLGHFRVIFFRFWGYLGGNYKKNWKKITHYCHNVLLNHIGHNVGVEMCHHRGNHCWYSKRNYDQGRHLDKYSPRRSESINPVDLKSKKEK